MVKTGNKLRIAHYGHKNPIGREGGVEIVVAEMATRQASLGHRVTCYNRSGHHVSGSEFDTPKVKEWNGVKMKYVPTISGKGLAAVSSAFFAALCCAVGPYDIVHVHAEGPAAFCWIPKLFGKKVVCTNHGLDWQRSKWQGGFGSKFIKYGEKMSAKHSDALIVLSTAIQGYFKRNYNKDSVVIPNGVNRPQKPEPQIIKDKYNLRGQDYLLYLSRITMEKRADLLIDAYNQINTDKRLVIAGGTSDSGQYLDKLREKAAGNPNIIFTGFVKGRLLAELYANAYAYILPSDIEGMPLSLLEAMSYGNCCLVSDIEECANVVEKNAILFKKGNFEDLKEKIQIICDDRNLVERYKQVASDFICDKYSWDETVERTLNLYGEVM